jgi:hypothetical protein
MFTKTYPHVNFFPPVRGYEFALLEERILKEYDLRKHPWCWGSSCFCVSVSTYSQERMPIQIQAKRTTHITEQLLKNQSSKIDTSRYPLTVFRPCGQEDNSVRLSEHCFHIGLGTEFRSEKIRIDSEWFPLFRGRKCSFRGIPSSAVEPVPKFGMELYVKQSHSCCA